MMSIPGILLVEVLHKTITLGESRHNVSDHSNMLYRTKLFTGFFQSKVASLWIQSTNKQGALGFTLHPLVGPIAGIEGPNDSPIMGSLICAIYTSHLNRVIDNGARRPLGVSHSSSWKETTANVRLIYGFCKTAELRLNMMKIIFPDIRIFILKMRWSWDHISYLYDGNHYIGKTVPLYWDGSYSQLCQ